METSRRMMLAGALAILPFGMPATRPVVPPSLLALIEGRFTDRLSLRATAEVYFRQYPGEFDLTRLCGLLLDGINVRADGLLDQLRQSAVREFAAGDVVLIDGWVLARSEARLFAAASLVIADV